MTPEDRARRLLEDIERLPHEAGPVVLSEAYSRAVEALEVHGSNQSGSDKSWVPRALTEFGQHYRRARRR